MKKGFVNLHMAIFLLVSMNFIFPLSSAEEGNCPQGYQMVDFPYSITDVNMKNLCYENSAKSLIISLEVQENNGIIFLDIPRILLDAKQNDCKDDKFFVIVNGEEREYSETKKEKFRGLEIPLKIKDVELEIGVPLQLESIQPNLEFCQSSIQREYSPYKQVKWALFSEQVQCKEGFDLIHKVSDRSPACVKPESISKLIERGWAKS